MHYTAAKARHLLFKEVHLRFPKTHQRLKSTIISVTPDNLLNVQYCYFQHIISHVQPPMDVSSESMDEQSYWIYVPDLCLQNIFLNLGDRDRCNASLVCRKWNTIMNSAALWRSRTITFNASSLTSNAKEHNAAKWYIWRFGSYIEYLDIRFLNSYSALFTKKFQRVMSDILSDLSKSNQCLKRLSIPYLGLERFIWKSPTKDAFIRSLCLFLQKIGKHLEHLNLKGAKMSLEHGHNVLSSLSFSSNVTSIKELNIEDFFCAYVQVYSNETFSADMSTFHNLRILSLNYNCVSDDLLQILCVNCSHSLSTINITCHVYNPHPQKVWGMYWAKLAKTSNKLNVNFFFDKVMLYSHLSRILLCEIPVRSISIKSSILNDPDWYMGPTLSGLLPNYRRTLKKLTLEFSNCHESVDEELLNLVLMCEKLHYLKVWAFLNIQFVEDILQNCEDGKCFLGTLKARIYINNYDTEEQDQLLYMIFRRHKDYILTHMDYYVITYPMV